MNKHKKYLSTAVILAIIVGMIIPATILTTSAVPSVQPESRLQPALADVATADPNQMVRVIVQKASPDDQAESLVEYWGGQVIKDLEIINGFAAQMTARTAVKLSQTAAVNWVSLDAPVISTGKPDKGGGGEPTLVTMMVRDEFNQRAYNNDDGSAYWISNWEEYDDDGSPTSGQILVDESYRIHLENKDFGVLEYVQRKLDLSAAVTAILTFDYSGFGEGGLDIFAVDVSSDGVNYTTLESVEVVGEVSGSKSYDLTGMVEFMPEVIVRFRLVQGFAATTQFIAFDNIQVQYDEQVESDLPENVYLETLDVRDVWTMGYTGADIGVAVIDSGISSDHDLNLRIRESFNPNSSSVNDVYGHGTHVAGIIGGNGHASHGQYMGIAPDVDLISLKISDETGLAYESDTVDAMQWVFDNKDRYNIRVLNLSIQSTIEQSYHDSALNTAAEILWFNGVVVVAATGNWHGGTVYPLNAAPGNDPYIITVGATDEKGTARIQDDRPATFSVWGYTQDGFIKPEIYAPGVDIISVLSRNSEWEIEHPERSVLDGEYFRISGTSMATPMVSGAIALLLQAEPNLTPDQVKYRIMNTHNWAGSSPYLSVYNMLTTPTNQSANQDLIPHMLLAKMAMIAYWANAEGEENIDWDTVNWDAVNWNAVNWNAVNWNAVNWNAVNWNAVNWNAVNWNAVNWNAVNWNAVNWNAVNWNAVNWNAVNWNAVNWNAVNWNAVNWNASYWLEE